LPTRQTRIQRKNHIAILDAALEVFSLQGFRGATLDEIANVAQISKPNILYYFTSKDAIYTALLTDLLATWLDPLRAIDPEGDPITEIMTYLRCKLDLSRDFPRESRLFANEIIQGAPRLKAVLETELKELVDDKVKIFTIWMNAGKIAQMHPVHLLFSIWSLTQHYADFDAQVQAVSGPSNSPHYADAWGFLELLFTKLLRP
jgi:TetR/AcrR family transcriptional regulator|tara:strand:- start:2367 stop:2975 length:609 start_codon:yes stop_codon:yes gene_type:complete